MSQTALTESQLHLAVEELRSQHSNTLDLYKAVAALLFFQYDSTPTTNRMYQLVRKGSMGAPAEALKLFWQELRERSQLRMEQADIPSSLKHSTGLLLAQLWEEGLTQALQITQEKNQAIYTKIGLAEQEKAEALTESKKIQNALLIAQQQLQKQDVLIDEFKKNAHELQVVLTDKMQQIQTLQHQYETTLLNHQEKIKLHEQRGAEMEKYARLEIERVRQDAIKMQKLNQEQLSEQKKKNITLEQQLQDYQTEQITQQHAYLYLEKQLSDLGLQHQQTQLKNEELHLLLQQLQPKLKPTRSPSRLAKLRLKK